MHKRLTILGPTKVLAGALVLGLPMVATAQVQKPGSAASVDQSFSAFQEALSATANELLARAQRPSGEVRSRADMPSALELMSGLSSPPETQTERTLRMPQVLQRMQALRALLEPILREEGIPPQMAAVVLVESGGRTTALSPKGARGLWQIMPDTARRYGLVVSTAVDERLDPYKSTRAAARYLSDLYTQFGNWPLALAAYNAGEDAVERAIERASSRDFNSIARAGMLPLETRNYVPAVLSAIGMMKETAGRYLTTGAGKSASAAVVYAAVPGVTFDAHQLSNEDVARIRQIPYNKRLSVIAPKVLSAAEAEGQQVLLAGVDFKNEIKLRRWWRITGKTPDADTDVLVGYEVARALSIIQPAGETTRKAAQDGGHHSTEDQAQFTIVKGEVQLAGSAHHVTGVIGATGGPEDRMIFGDLSHVQKLVGKPNQVNVIEVSALCTGCPVEEIVAQIQDKLPHAKVSAIQQAVKARTEMVARLTRFSAAVAVVVLIIGGLMIFTTMMGSVVERTKEIGVLRAIGFRRTHIIRGLILEVAAISTAGGFLGWAWGLLGSWIVLPYFSEGGVGRELNPTLLVAALVGALVIGTLSSICPAVRAARLDPSEAVRYI